jgi:stage II sporulation protein AA (anti-sigma F factor antagonist)
MNIQINQNGAVCVVNISGDIDHHNADILRDKIDNYYERSACRHVVFDFNGVTFMDSSGIGLIIGRYKNTEKRGGSLSIAGMNDETRRIYQISGLAKIIRAYDSVEEAQRNLSKTGGGGNGR